MKYLVILLAFLCITRASSQESEDEPKDAAKDAQNPLANVISLPLQNNTDFGIGANDETGNVLNIQPVIPVTLTEKGWLLINRTIVPFPKTAPDILSDNGSSTGLGDITYTAWFSPPGKGKLTWGFGPVTVWPTASSEILGQGKFSIGPSFVFVYGTPKWMLAAIISDWFSVAGDEDRADVNTFYFQPIFTYFLPKKWYLSTAPIILSNWEAEKDQRWTVPLGGGAGKMFTLGKMPMDFQIQSFYNVVRPDGHSDWQLRVQLKLIFPTKKNRDL